MNVHGNENNRKGNPDKEAKQAEAEVEYTEVTDITGCISYRSNLIIKMYNYKNA